MSESNSVILVVVLTVIAAILLNLMLAFVVLTRSKKKDSGTYYQLFNLIKSVRRTFDASDAELDELTNSMDKVKNQNKMPEDNEK